MNSTTHQCCNWGLYVILDRAISGRSLVQAAEAVLAGGAKAIQLRDKESQFEDLVKEGRELRRLTSQAGAALIVNDNPYLAREIEADGVHLGQADFPPYIAREILGQHGIIGISTHTKQQAIAAVLQPVNYIAVGPLFATTSKQSEYKPLGVDHLRWVRQQVRLPLVAIGGLSAANIADVIAAGVENVAVIREVMAAEDIAGRVRDLVQLIGDARPIT
jgi:thiamine-phosphate pyrophosphorylase